MKSTIIICSIIIGAASFTPALAQRGPQNRVNQEYMEWKLRKDLGLNDDQIAKLKEMREKHQAQAEADRTALRDEMQARREVLRKEMESRREAMQEKAAKRQEEMKSILTPEQYQKWQDLRFENFENRRQDRNFRQGNRAGRGNMYMRGAGPNRPGMLRGYRNAPMQRNR